MLRFIIYDVKDGSLLWEYEISAAGFATPVLYSVDGKQYVVIAAGEDECGLRQDLNILLSVYPSLTSSFTLKRN